MEGTMVAVIPQHEMGHAERKRRESLGAKYIKHHLAALQFSHLIVIAQICNTSKATIWYLVSDCED